MPFTTTRQPSLIRLATTNLTLAALLLAGCGDRADSDAPQPQARTQRVAASANGTRADVAMHAPSTNFTTINNGDSYTVTDNVGTAGSQTFARGTRLDFSDVTVELDTTGPAAQTYLLYQAAFNRQPDLPGLGFWIDYVDGGASMVDVAAGFMMSKEFTDQYGAHPSPQTLITKLYANVLHRAPDSDGNQFWLGAMANGATPAQVLNWFSSSPENQAQMASQVARGVAYIPVPKPGLYLLAGDGVSGGNIDGAGASASFDNPNGMAIDGAGNLYTSDAGSNRIRKITPQGQVSTLAGGSILPDTVDGSGAAARFQDMRAIAADGAGNLYVLDRSGTLVRKVTPDGVVSSYAGCFPVAGSANCDPQHASLPLDARFIAADKAGVLYIATTVAVFRIDTSGKISAYAGTTGAVSPSDSTRFARIGGLAVDGQGNLYVANTFGSTIVRVGPSGSLSVVAGVTGQPGAVDGGPATGRLQLPGAIAFDGDGALYIIDFNAIRKLTPAGDLSTIAGAQANGAGAVGAPGQAAQFWLVGGIAVDAAHHVYIADTFNHAVRQLGADGQLRSFAGSVPVGVSIDGSTAQARFAAVNGLAVNAAGTVLVADYASVRTITPDNVVTSIAVGGPNTVTGGIAVDGANNIFVSDNFGHAIDKISPAGVASVYANLSNPLLVGRPVAPAGMAVDSQGQLFVADLGSALVRNLGTAGASDSDLISSYAPSDVAFGPTGTMYVAAPSANAVLVGPQFTRLGNPAGVAGYADGALAGATFNGPSALAIDSAGNTYVADTANHLIRKITPDGTVTTVAGTPELSGTRVGSLPGVLYRPSAIKVIGMKTLLVSSGANVIKIVLP